MKLLDLETTGLSFKKDRILGVGTDTGFHTNLDEVKKELQENNELVGQNIKFDIKFLRAQGIECKAGFDTMLAASLLPDRPEKLDLETLALHYIPHQEKWKHTVNRKKLEDSDTKSLAEYCLTDVKVTKELADRVFDRLDKHNLLGFYMSLLNPAYNMLIDMEERGMRIDVNRLPHMIQSFDLQLSEITERIHKIIPGVNVASPKQLQPALNSLGLFPSTYVKKYGDHRPSTSYDALEALLPNPLIEDILMFRSITKLKGYIKSWSEEHVNGYLHPSFNMASTRTGRLSCSDPNLQQVPRDKRIRSLFIPSEGYTFIIADYAQIEPRIAAHYSQDEALLDVFNKGQDLYGTIARDILGVTCEPNEVKIKHPELRAVAKEVALSILYGIGPRKLRESIKIGSGIVYSEDQCAQFIRTYFEKYQGLKGLRDHVEHMIRMRDNVVFKDGRAYAGTIRNHFGRKNLIVIEDAYLTGVNTLIQSSASDAMLFGACKLYAELKEKGIDARPVALVHDEIILECKPEYVNIVKELMNEILTNQGFTVPLKLDIAVGNSWAEKG